MTSLRRYSKLIAAGVPVVAGFLVQLFGPDSAWVPLITAAVTVVSTYLAPPNEPKPMPAVASYEGLPPVVRGRTPPTIP